MVSRDFIIRFVFIIIPRYPGVLGGGRTVTRFLHFANLDIFQICESHNHLTISTISTPS